MKRPVEVVRPPTAKLFLLLFTLLFYIYIYLFYFVYNFEFVLVWVNCLLIWADFILMNTGFMVVMTDDARSGFCVVLILFLKLSFVLY